ncbi:hypothetical protein DVR12_17725 [Chitinophaga silvatica]|uniref:DUF433 domain-containing protein n=1 Tax=Chitinophaga silvatica TaxID=2282649 RepID=A0A3E1Y832_9BACT|nr:hypothetical protein [Chitinophaga silvatica]RFS21173.1 hypothetical protein DVR12_17725 [Chitinophaga silvatica]
MNLIERNEVRGFGQPVLLGRRLTVFNTLFYANARNSIGEFLEEFAVSIDELKSAVSYCKNRECKTLHHPTDKYCDGCILRSFAEGYQSTKNDFTEEGGISYSKDGTIIFLGTLTELDDDEFGQLGWILAEKVEKRLLVL